MQNFFNARWITFYGVTIAFVIALFSIATNYGEANLKAPTKIAGRYRIDAKNLPGCLKAQTLFLTIDQSGIYVNGSITKSENSTAINSKRRSLIGLWNNQKLTLSGMPQLQPCQSNSQIEINGTISANANGTKQTQLNGQISLASQGSTDFTAQLEK